MKAGWKTSEFWLSLAAALVGFVLASGILEATSTTWDDRIVGLIVMGLTSIGYTVSRGIAKKPPAGTP